MKFKIVIVNVCEQYEYKRDKEERSHKRVILVPPTWVSLVPTILVRFSTR